MRVCYQLKPFSKDQTHKYIDYLIGSSGGDVKIFDEGVKDLIHEFTGGKLGQRATGTQNKKQSKERV